MDFLPFEIYSAPFPRDEYGLIYEIPEYCTEDELERVSEAIKENTHLVNSDTYPNIAINLPFITHKTQLIYDHRDSIFDHVLSTFDRDGINYSFSRLWEKMGRSLVEYRVREVLQATPKGMGEYPIHNDGAKSMTILVPLSPVKSVPTRFHGCHPKWKNDMGYSHPFVSVPWKVNHAYLFFPSVYSWHSYRGDNGSDRWIYNINLLTQDIPLK